MFQLRTRVSPRKYEPVLRVIRLNIEIIIQPRKGRQCHSLLMIPVQLRYQVLCGQRSFYQLERNLGYKQVPALPREEIMMSDLSDLERLVIDLIPPSEHDIFGRNIPVGTYFAKIKLGLWTNVSQEALRSTLDSLIKKKFLIQLNKDFFGRTGKPVPSCSE